MFFVQECVEAGLWFSPEYYCADFCDPRRCLEGESCTLQEVVCLFGVACPPVAVCESDPCDGACDDTQVGDVKCNCHAADCSRGDGLQQNRSGKLRL